MAILYGMVWAGDYCIEGHGVLNVVLCCSILGLGMFDIIWFAVNHDGLCLKPLWRKSQSLFFKHNMFLHVCCGSATMAGYIAMTLWGNMYHTKAQKGQRMNLYKMSTGRRGPPYHSHYNWLLGLTTHQPFCFQLQNSSLAIILACKLYKKHAEIKLLIHSSF